MRKEDFFCLDEGILPYDLTTDHDVPSIHDRLVRMEILDRFATSVLPAVYAGYDADDRDGRLPVMTISQLLSRIASTTYDIAEAMLAEREKRMKAMP